MPAIAVAETTDITPWGGFEVTHGKSVCLGPLLTPLGRTVIDSGGGVLTITADRVVRLKTSIPGRLRQIDLQPGSAKLELPAGPAGWIEIPGAKLVLARFEGEAIAERDGRIEILARGRPGRLELFRESA
jgi:hypothetical protein